MRRLALLLLVGAAACDPGRFDELSERAPVRELVSATDATPASFGDAFVGAALPFASGKAQAGTMVVTLGNGPAGITTSVITGDGGSTGASGTSSEDLAAMGRPTRLEAVALGPTGAAPTRTPLIYVSGGETVRLIDPILYQPPYAPALVMQHDASWGAQLGGLGLSLAAMTLDGSGLNELVIAGARDALALLRVKGLRLDKGRVLAGAEWRSGACRALAVGALGPSNQTVVVAGMSDQDAVRVLLDPAGCVDKATCSSLELAAPAGARGFGASVLLAGLGGPAAGNQLLVGAPGSGQVFVYTFTAADVAPPPPLVITAPAGSGQFGAALSVDPSTNERIIVGAPATAVDGAADAGALYLYDQAAAGASAPLATVSLASAQSGRQLGRRLGVVPFLLERGGAVSLLAASGSQAVYLFFTRDLRTGRDDVHSLP